MLTDFYRSPKRIYIYVRVILMLPVRYERLGQIECEVCVTRRGIEGIPVLPALSANRRTRPI